MNSTTTDPAKAKRQAQALLQQGHVEQAYTRYEQLCRRYPRDAEVWFYRAYIDTQRGHLEAACAGFQRVLALDPRATAAQANLGCVYLHLGRPSEAATVFRAVLATNPQDAQTHKNLALALRDQDPQRALESLQSALRLRPAFPEAEVNLGGVWRSLGHFSEAEAAYRRAIRLAPTFAEAYTMLGKTLQDMGDLEAAEHTYRQGLAHLPGQPDMIAGLAHIAEHRGEFAAARALLEPLLQQGASLRALIAFGIVSRHTGEQQAAIARLTGALDTPNLPSNQQLDIHFTLGKLYDAQGDYPQAYRHYHAGNRLKPAPFDAPAHARQIDALIALWTHERLARLPRAQVAGGVRPIFIVGMPRSGTSLAEQILASHPTVHGAGELNALPRRVDAWMHGLFAHGPIDLEQLTLAALDGLATGYLDELAGIAPHAVHVVDKMMSNYYHMGVIALAFPGARIIHCVRDAEDTCLSCYFQNFGGHHPYAYDLADLGHYYHGYRRLMEHWKRVSPLSIYDLDYAALIADPERQIRALLDHCQLEWDARCLDFHSTRRNVTTASYDQVRRPIYKEALGRARHYAQYLQPLRAALAG